MVERIDKLEDTTNFYSGPAEFLAEKIAAAIAAVPQFAAVFGTSIDSYKRDDYSIRELPALRVYNESYVKDFESWFINGEILLDVIFPTNLRRKLQQKYQDIITSALCQQFRRDSFFLTVGNDVPGLNELGKEYTADKSLGFVWGGNATEAAPLTQIRANFRLDLRQWDDFLISDDRTKNDPFEKTLGDLQSITSVIDALKDDDTVELSIEANQSI